MENGLPSTGGAQAAHGRPEKATLTSAIPCKPNSSQTQTPTQLAIPVSQQVAAVPNASPEALNFRIVSEPNRYRLRLRAHTFQVWS